MITSNEKLCLFHKAKNEKIKETLRKYKLGYPKDVKPYMGPEDYEDIMSWRKEEADRIWNEIVRKCNMFRAQGLDSDTCGFCQRYNIICAPCTYATRHGECGTSTTNTLSWLRNLPIDWTTVLTRKWYYDLCNKINKEQKI